MSDNTDLAALRDAAEAVQDAIGVLVERIEALLPEPEPAPIREAAEAVQGALGVLVERIDALRPRAKVRAWPAAGAGLREEFAALHYWPPGHGRGVIAGENDLGG